MPFIHIRSLPFERPIDVPGVITRVGREFAERNGIPLEHVHTTWDFFRPGHFAKGDEVPEFQPEAPHSVLVDLLTPDFNDAAAVEAMLTSLAGSLSRHARIPIRKIFIHHLPARSGMVFDDGEVVRW